MTAVHPPRAVVDEAHLVAWTAGYQAANEAAHAEGFEAGRKTGWEAGYQSALDALAADGQYQQGRLHGYQQALHDVAVRAAELDITGALADRKVRSEAAARIRARRQAAEDRARERYVAEGRQEYHGGPIPWDNGEAA